MATEAGPGKLRAGRWTLKELESGTAAWEQGRPSSAHCQLLSRALCCIEKGQIVARAPCGHPSHPCRAPHLLSGAPLAPQPLLTHYILLPSITLPLPWLPALPLAPMVPPCLILVIPHSHPSVVPSQPRASPGMWRRRRREAETACACWLLFCAAHQGQCTLLQPTRRPGAGKEEEVNPKLPWMVPEETTQNLNP